MEFVHLFLLILTISKFHNGEASIPNYLIQKIDTSLTSLEGKTTEIKSTLDQQERKYRAEFSEIKQLIKSLTNKISLAGESTVSNTKSPSALSSSSAVPSSLDDSETGFWDNAIKFCNESKHNILQDGSARNAKHFQYASTNEDLNKCVYLDGLCGGVLVGKKGIISYRGEDIKNFTPNGNNNRTRCIWTVRTNDHKNKFRLFLRNNNTTKNGFKLSITSMQSLITGANNTAANAATLAEYGENTISSLPKWSNNGSSRATNTSSSSLDFTLHSKHGNDVFFITLAYNRTNSVPDFFLQFEGHGLHKPATKYFHYHRSGEKGLFHSRVDFTREGQRTQHEFASFVINPYNERKPLSPFQLNLTEIHTQNAASHEFVTFYESSESGMRYNVAGEERAVNNRYFGWNRTFPGGEFIGDCDYSEAIIGIYKFFNTNENSARQESGVEFSW